MGNTDGGSAPMPSGPSTPPAHGSVVLREFADLAHGIAVLSDNTPTTL